MDRNCDLTIVIPSFNRGSVLCNTIDMLDRLRPRAREVLVVDQTPEHPPAVAERLRDLEHGGCFRHVRLGPPSIPAAMNRGLELAGGTRVLFLDDDIVPHERLIEGHLAAGARSKLVAGQVLQPGEVASVDPSGRFEFRQERKAWVAEFMGGNFSIERRAAILLGGFDENFVGAAYRFEAEFAARYCRAYGPILFDPAASIRHLAVPKGGTRERAHHLRTASPHHTVGAYYYLLRARPRGWRGSWIVRPLRAVRTRHHLRRPWWIPLTLLAELRGMMAALGLHRAGPRYGFEPSEVR